MKIKIVSYYQQGYVSDHDPNWVMRDCTDWDEVTDDEYKVLVKWVAKKNREQFEPQYIIYRQEDVSATARIKDYFDMMAAEELAAEEKRKKREAKARARALAAKKLKEAEERAKFEELSKKYGAK